MGRRSKPATRRTRAAEQRRGAGVVRAPAAVRGVTDAHVNPRPGSSPAPAEDVEPAALVVAHWFDSGDDEGEPYTATVRLTGRRLGTTGRPAEGDLFTRVETIPGIVPGSGPVSVTSWIYGIDAGEWDVAAELVGPKYGVELGRGHRSGTAGPPLPRARWTWRRWAVSDAPASAMKTRWAPIAPLAASPAVLPGSFTILAVLAIVAALVSQAFILNHERLSIGPALGASLVAILVGLLGAKAWYVALRGRLSRETLREGWSVDGFLVAAPVVALMAITAQGQPLGLYLDAVTPGIFLAVAIGRIGCFLTGCCAGQPTRSRWGLWSSDRRIGARRIPTQLLESATGLALALASTGAVFGHLFLGTGLTFLVSILLYVAARQALLRLRSESRPFSWRRSALLPHEAS